MMIKQLLIFLIGIFSSTNIIAQIWDYPPKAITNYIENSDLPKDSLQSLTIWSHKIIDGKDSGKKELLMIQEFDSIGNTVKIINGYGDTVIYDRYINGYWQLKITNNKTYHKTINFDDNGNVIKVSINDFTQSVKYDSLNRPIIAKNNSETFYWRYTGEHLSEYLIYKEIQLIEKRIFYYDTIKHTISYTSNFCDSNGKFYPNPDSVSAYFNKENEIFKIESFSYYSSGWDTLIMEFDREKDMITTISNSNNTQEIQTYRNKQKYPITIIVRNSEGLITKKTSYEYLFRK